MFGIKGSSIMKTFKEQAMTTSGLPTTQSPEINYAKKKQTFAGGRVFNVKSSTLMKARYGHRKWHNYEKLLSNEECLDDVRSFCKTDRETPVILKDEFGVMVYLRR